MSDSPYSSTRNEAMEELEVMRTVALALGALTRGGQNRALRWVTQHLQDLATTNRMHGSCKDENLEHCDQGPAWPKGDPFLSPDLKEMSSGQLQDLLHTLEMEQTTERSDRRSKQIRAIQAERRRRRA